MRRKFKKEKLCLLSFLGDPNAFYRFLSRHDDGDLLTQSTSLITNFLTGVKIFETNLSHVHTNCK